MCVCVVAGLEAENAALKEMVQSLQRRCDRLEDGGRREEGGGYSGRGGGSDRGSGGGDVNERPAVLGGFSLAIPSRQQAPGETGMVRESCCKLCCC